MKARLMAQADTHDAHSQRVIGHRLSNSRKETTQMSNFPHTPIRGGFRCPITGREFHVVDHTRAARHETYRLQQSHTGAIVHDLEKRFGRRSIEEYRRLYREDNE